ncbi:MAG: tetratricopeptide repeat protein, partial [Phascolarctobacterium sp.]
CYKNGLGIDIDIDKGIEWYQKAAYNGFLKAYEELGKCYFLGRGLPRDYYYAVECFHKSGAQSPEIQFYLGGCYVHGYGVEKDIRIGLSWYRKAAEADYALAQLCLGEHYYLGKGVLVDSFEALKWFRKAAQEKNHRAQYYLAEFYYKGYIVDKDLQTAFDWYVMAANGGDELAVKALINKYSHDCITGISREECLKCFENLAEKGIMDAQYEAGYLREYYSADKDRALYWYRLACDNGVIAQPSCPPIDQ